MRFKQKKIEKKKGLKFIFFHQRHKFYSELVLEPGSQSSFKVGVTASSDKNFFLSFIVNRKKVSVFLEGFSSLKTHKSLYKNNAQI